MNGNGHRVKGIGAAEGDALERLAEGDELSAMAFVLSAASDDAGSRGPVETQEAKVLDHRGPSRRMGFNELFLDARGRL